MDTERLIKLIRTKIKVYQRQVENIMNQNNSTFEKYREVQEELEKDPNYITTLSLEELAEMLSGTSLNEDERELEFNYLKSVKSLLELNQTKKTTFQLSEKQKSYLEIFKTQLKELEEITKQQVKERLEEASAITDKIKELRSLLGLIEDPKNKEYIDQTDIIQSLIETLDETEQRAILYGVIRYNQSMYEEKMNAKEIAERPRLNIEEVKEVFKSYDYDFSDLKEEVQETLLAYGDMNRILEVFDSLQKNRFPRFDLKRNGKKLVSLLINSRASIIEEIVAFSREKGIYPRDLLMLIPALAEQREEKRTRGSIEGGNATPFITGRDEDYKKNIEFLESIGFQISYIFHKCKDLLIMPNQKLVSNYRKFILYGFEIPTDQYGDLCHPALSCLLSTSFDEIVDQFIEISREGHQYIKENMSRITTTTSPKDLLFYNIYASYMNQDELGEYMVPEGPFSGANHKKLKLRGEITRYAGSGFENIPYRGLTEENKEQKTMTIEVDCQNKDEFDRVVEEHKGYEDDLYNLVFNDDLILALEKYVDISDPLRYEFDGVLISKQKVLRIYNILKNEHLESLEDSLLYALTYNSILSQEDLDKIKNVVKEVLQDRRK